MKQENHSNARTNIHIRSLINNSDSTNLELSKRFEVSKNTICKWKNRTTFEDKSSKPNNIKYSLSYDEMELLIHLRSTTWWALDEIVELVYGEVSASKRSAVYRLFKTNNINNVPQEKKEEAKKFKEYSPGYLHLDVTYLPKINGKKRYLYVVIDRATRLMFYKIYDNKTAINTQNFVLEAMDFLPFNITHILTDNGLEFTNRLLKSKKGESCKKASLLDEICLKENIEHRLTEPFTPKTNGMVERVNKTIKDNTIKINKYQDLQQMEADLYNFLQTYNTVKRHSSLRKELNVKTPLKAVYKWYELEPEIFKEKPIDFENKVISLSKLMQGIKQQPCET
ncbi:integrase core domain-containing protein [Flavobacterium branchiophilum]|uniref:IS481 family transposase n=1 Tax=Flavobacterium branchiophilum TaxID=55197 RepID=A0A2H3KRT0_9FLAO|nr:integrase core domain-containing protein [Flavobacterium branchiophilum]PDS21858.1 IS481 family transposase [Flavobacterium branchiophilum]